MRNKTQKWFIVNGLLLLLVAMIFPFYAPWAHAEEGIRKVHLIGTFEALLSFAFAWIWPQLVLTRFANRLAIALIYIAFWANIIGSALIAFMGVNTLVHLFLSMSEYIVIPILIALLGFFRTTPYRQSATKWLNASMVVLTLLFTVLILWQSLI